MALIPSFAEWVAAAFDHSVGSPEWYWAEEFDDFWADWAVPPLLTVEYLARLFRENGCLAAYSLEQVAQGIWFLMDSSSPAGIAYCLLDSDVPVEQRLDCIRAMSDFFSTFVAAAAPGPSRHHSDPFHIAIYMWWDIFPFRFESSGAGSEVGACCLGVMTSTLKVPSELCQINALHGLNHWQPSYPREVADVIDEFIAHGVGLSPTVRDYAQVAIGGGAL